MASPLSQAETNDLTQVSAILGAILLEGYTPETPSDVVKGKQIKAAQTVVVNIIRLKGNYPK